MKNLVFLIFFSIVFLIYFSGSWYVFNRGMHALQQTQYRTLFAWIFWILSFSFVVGQFLERMSPTLSGKIVTYVGSFWLVTLLYLFLLILSIDIVRLFDHWFHFIPVVWKNTFLSGKWLFVEVGAIALLVVLAGHINAINPRIERITLPIDKAGSSKKEIKIALVTDIHMGFIIGNHRVSKLVNQINSLNPDLVLFGGDLVDHNPLPVIKDDMGANFLRLNPPLGKYAITGNHEFIGHPEVSINYLSKFGITYLRDTIVNVDNLLLLAGRDDKDKQRFEGKPRKTLSQIMNGTHTDLPLILMDHQPVDYVNAEKAGADLMVSGHTHKGQIWPFGYITSKVYELDWGLLKRNKTWFYVSSGYGTWGPPVRLGNRPEIVLFTLKLN